MNSDTLKGKWHELKGDAKVRWGKLTDDDLTQIDGNIEKLTGVLEQRYGYAREEAMREVKEFQRLHKPESAHTSR